jgi:hypothetical protein
VKNKDIHEDRLDKEIQYQHIMAAYLLERQINPVPMENTEKGDMVTVKSLKFTQKNVFVDG